MAKTDEACEANQNRFQLQPELRSLMEEAWQIRRTNFPMEITSVSPIKTQAVSVTGTACALDCAHCGKHYLKGMLPLDAALKGQCQPRPESYLISGGCTSKGKVPLMAHLEALQRLKGNARFNLHTGLVSKEEAKALAEVADVVSFDFIGSTDIIHQVYGLDLDIQDYINSFRALAEAMGTERVVPHVTIGLLGGKLSHELAAAEILAGEGIKSLVLLVFIPTPGTRFGNLAPPSVEETAGIIARLRILLPEVSIGLGCMRPGGKYRIQLDELALRCGINKIVKPAPGFEAQARELGLEIKYEEECCTL